MLEEMQMNEDPTRIADVDINEIVQMLSDSDLKKKKAVCFHSAGSPFMCRHLSKTVAAKNKIAYARHIKRDVLFSFPARDESKRTRACPAGSMLPAVRIKSGKKSKG